jgi:hypothetical protein
MLKNHANFLPSFDQLGMAEFSNILLMNQDTACINRLQAI